MAVVEAYAHNVLSKIKYEIKIMATKFQAQPRVCHELNIKDEMLGWIPVAGSIPTRDLKFGIIKGIY